MKNLKILGLALVAVFAMSAVVASGASALSPAFTSEGSPTILTGSQEGSDVFTTHGGTVTCTTATYEGTQTGTESSETEVTPTYSGCTAFGFVNVPIDVNGCKYVFTANQSMHIVCPAEKSIEVTAPGCTVTVGTQTPTGPNTIEYTNIGAGTTMEVTLDVSLSGIHYIEHNKGSFPTCSFPTETTTNGTYSGHAKVTGETAAHVHTGITWHA
jgi:archaellum component FlaF (FlaF/FlaG flagellin family)